MSFLPNASNNRRQTPEAASDAPGAPDPYSKEHATRKLPNAPRDLGETRDPVLFEAVAPSAGMRLDRVDYVPAPNGEWNRVELRGRKWFGDWVMPLFGSLTVSALPPTDGDLWEGVTDVYTAWAAITDPRL